MRKPGGEYACFAGTGARKHQNRAIQRQHGVALLRIQAPQVSGIGGYRRCRWNSRGFAKSGVQRIGERIRRHRYSLATPSFTGSKRVSMNPRIFR